MRSRSLWLALGVGVLAVVAMVPAGGLAQGDAERRMADRLAQLRQEADALAKQGKTVLGDLRRLELDRQIRSEELDAIQKDLASARQKLADANERAAALNKTAAVQTPDIEDRLLRLYKMGRAGYWRLLLDVDDVRALGRAYRTAAALTALDRQQVLRHQQTLRALAREVSELDARTRELAALESRAVAARAAVEKAVATRAALVTSIETRRDLAEQLAAELDAAQLRLQSTLAQRPDATPAIPFRPFRGALPWPAQGIVISQFGRDRAAPGIEFSRNGIQLSLAEGRPVAAIHDGIVTHAGPFSGLGQLVIVDHGSGTASLYGYLSSTSVNKGDRVTAGTNVGTSGRNTSGNPALYFELRVDGAPVDPLQWLRRP